MYFTYESQILLGTVLGGSSLVRPVKGKNYYLSMRDGFLSWLEYKMAEMPTYFGGSEAHQYGRTYRCNSKCDEELTELQGRLYAGNQRRITMEILDSLQDIGIAVWFLDGGSKTGRGRKNAYINTTKFGEEGTMTVLQYFNEVGMECNDSHDGKRRKILFTVKGTLSLFKTIAHRFPKFMYDRL